jgi:hypothetical protein
VDALVEHIKLYKFFTLQHSNSNVKSPGLGYHAIKYARRFNMRIFLIVAVLVGFVVGVVLGCASSKDVAAVQAAPGDAKFQVVAGNRTDGNVVFLRYDVQTGEGWTWAPMGSREWVSLIEMGE